MALALRQSEQQFRESYLRAVLSRSRSQKEAASLAGVPYTTLCSMLKKLGIEPGRVASHLERREASSGRVPSAWRTTRPEQTEAETVQKSRGPGHSRSA